VVPYCFGARQAIRRAPKQFRHYQLMVRVKTKGVDSVPSEFLT
jgi:hypothetical protein